MKIRAVKAISALSFFLAAFVATVLFLQIIEGMGLISLGAKSLSYGNLPDNSSFSITPGLVLLFLVPFLAATTCAISHWRLLGKVQSYRFKLLASIPVFVLFVGAFILYTAVNEAHAP